MVTSDTVTHPGTSLVKNSKGVNNFLRRIIDQITKMPCCGISKTRVVSTRKTDVSQV